MRKKIVQPLTGPPITPLGYFRDDARRMLGGIGPTLLDSLIDQGLLTKRKLGRRTIITAESLQKLVGGGR